jgi:hypothetical protein
MYTFVSKSKPPQVDGKVRFQVLDRDTLPGDTWH